MTVFSNKVLLNLVFIILIKVNPVRDACCKFLMKQLHPSNCLGIRRFADTHSCTDLLQLSQEFIMRHFVEVCETEEFVLLSHDDVRTFIQLKSNKVINFRVSESK